MSSRKKKSKVVSLRSRRKRQEEDIKKSRKSRDESIADDTPWESERWFELTEYFDPHKIVPVKMKDADKMRMFVLGTIDNLAILQVPAETDPRVATMALEALHERGVTALAFPEHVQFVRLRMCSADEEELLNDADKDKRGLIKIRWTPQEVEEAKKAAKPIELSKPRETEEPQEQSGECEEVGEGDEDLLLPSERFARDQKH